MNDIRARLAALDEIETPDLWPQIEQRVLAGPAASDVDTDAPWQRPFAVARFGLAAAFVVFLGGFVILNLITAPQDESQAPVVGASMTAAPATQSPTPNPTLFATAAEREYSDMLGGLQVTTLSPGIQLVLADDAGNSFIPWRTPFSAAAERAVRVVAGPTVGQDGSLWVVGEGDDRPPELIQLGRRRTTPFPDGFGGDEPELEIGPAGTPWLTGPFDLASYDGRKWIDYEQESIELDSEIVALPDGSVWVAGFSRDPVADFFDPTEGSIGLLIDGDLVDRRAQIAPVLDADAQQLRLRELTPAVDGSLWALADVMDGPRGERSRTELLRHDGGTWTRWESPVGDVRARLVRLAADPDGSLWAYYTGVGDRQSVTDGVELAHVTGDSVTRLTGADDAVPLMRGWLGPDRDPDALQVGSDGTVWLATDDGRLASFDGSAWTTHALRELDRFVLGPDGSIITLDRQGSILLIATETRSLSAASPLPRSAAGETSTSLVTEEVEPGVHRVISDGIRELSFPDFSDQRGALDTYSILVSPSGEVWILGKAGYHALGDPGHLWAERSPYTDRASDQSLDGSASPRDLPRTFEPSSTEDIEIGLDGSIWYAMSYAPWTHQQSPSDSYGEIEGLWLFDGERWSLMGPEGRVGSVEVQSDGTVWASWDDLDEGTTTVRRYDGNSWEDVGDPIVWPLDLNARAELHISEDGQAALLGLDRMYVYEGNEWVVVADGGDLTVIGSEVADNGSGVVSWIAAVPDDGQSDRLRLKRFDGSGWQDHADADVPGKGKARLRPFHEIAPDGSVWMPIFGDRECGGIGKFDGDTWSRYLKGACITSMDIAPDGTVWLHGSVIEWDRAGNDMQRVRQLETFFITPEDSVASG